MKSIPEKVTSQESKKALAASVDIEEITKSIESGDPPEKLGEIIINMAKPYADETLKLELEDVKDELSRMAEKHGLDLKDISSASFKSGRNIGSLITFILTLIATGLSMYLGSGQ